MNRDDIIDIESFNEEFYQYGEILHSRSVVSKLKKKGLLYNQFYLFRNRFGKTQYALSHGGEYRVWLYKLKM